MKSVSEDFSQSILFQKVSEICSLVTLTLNSQELLDLSLKAVVELFGAARGSIFLMDEKQGSLELAAFYGFYESVDRSKIKKFGAGIIGKIAQIKKTIVVEDIANDSRFSGFKARGTYKTA